MFQTTIGYGDADEPLDDEPLAFDDVIRAIARRYDGEEIGRRYCMDDEYHDFTFDFPDEKRLLAAWGEWIEAAGGKWSNVEVHCVHVPDGMSMVELQVEFDPNCPGLQHDIASLLTDDLCSGWSHVSGEEDVISVWCRSPQAARFLIWDIERKSLDAFVSADLLDQEDAA
jgi:hypothetical protein